MTRALGLLVAALFIAAPASAEGGAGRTPAERHFRAGSQAFRAGKYLAAARAFEDAYESEPSPAVTFSAAQAYRRQYFVDEDVAWLLRAKLLYRRYLAEQATGGRREHAVTHLYAIELLLARRAGDAPQPAQALPTQVLVSCEADGASISLDGGPRRPAPLVAEVTAGEHRVRVTAPGHRAREARVLAVSNRLAVSAIELDALPGELLVKTSPGTEIWIDGSRAGVAPLSARSVGAGTHGVTLMRSGQKAVSRSVRVEREARTTIEVELEPSSQRVAAVWTLAGAGALGLGSAIAGGLSLLAERDANREKSGMDSGRALSPAERDRYNSALDRRNDYRTTSIGLLGAGLVTGAVGALLYVIDSPAPPAGRESARRGGRGSARY